MDSFACEYFDRLRVERIPKEIRKFTGHKHVKTNIYRIQAYDSKMYGYFLHWIIDFKLRGKISLKYTNLFSPNDYEKNHKIILIYFQKLKRWKKLLC